MREPRLYPGAWPRNVSRTAKYAIRQIDGRWRVTVLYEIDRGVRYLAVEGGGSPLPQMVNDLRSTLGQPPGGPFYINEYRHVIVPIRGDEASGVGSEYYFAGRFDGELVFDLDGTPLTGRPIRPDGSPLRPGDRWSGPRPGIPYVLTAGGQDIYFERPALTDDDPPRIRPRTQVRTPLSRIHGGAVAAKVAATIRHIRGHQGGRFYVNEYGAMFTPVTSDEGDLEYVYCGQLDLGRWFPEPDVP